MAVAKLPGYPWIHLEVLNKAQAEEKELDASKVQLAMAAITATQQADKEAQRLRYNSLVYDATLHDNLVPEFDMEELN